jgi:DNA-directed RNA polymerase III subunit RPC3
MANPFSRFVHTSPLSSIYHDPPVSLASNTIRDSFGPMVQLVADGLQTRGGPSTMAQILNRIHTKYHKKSMTGNSSRVHSRTKERTEIIRVSQLKTASSRDGPSTPAVRAALLVLIQHSMVTVTKATTTVTSRTTGKRSRRVVFHYQFDLDRAQILPRYPRFVEYTKKALDETAATLVEELLVQGRMKTVDAIVSTVEQLQQLRESANTTTADSSRFTNRQAVLESFRRLVAGGFIQKVPEIVDENEEDDEEEWFGKDEETGPPLAKKRRTESPPDDESEDPAVVALLQSGPYNKILPRDAIWRVNIQMFHDSFRAVSLGWLVAERYGPKVQSAGSIVTAALKLVAYKRHASSQQQEFHDFDSLHYFYPEDITRYLPKAVQQIFEKKQGGMIPNLSRALQDLCSCTDPAVVEEVEVADGKPGQAKFHITTNKLVGYLQDRIIHQIICDSHGEVSARICAILRHKGHLESDAIAEAAMVPAKETREVLHRLYRDNFIDLFNLNQGKQHNPASMFYLWSTSRPKSLRNATDSVYTALLNMRLRRQHEVEVGKDWIERAKEAGAIDENENEADKVNYTRFCQGLERLDIAALQLDETLMVLKDY